jgi:hypothetical protein
MRVILLTTVRAEVGREERVPGDADNLSNIDGWARAGCNFPEICRPLTLLNV